MSFVLILGSFTHLAGQNNTSSPYSRFGLGIMESGAFGSALAMGGAGIASQSPFDINTVNPASYSVFKFPENSIFDLLGRNRKKPNGRPFVFQVGTRAERIDRITDSQTDRVYNTSLVSLAGRFQLQNFWAVSFGLLPVSSIGYNIESTDSVSVGDYTSTLNTTYVGEGGLSSVYLGNSFYYKGFSVGFNASYVFGPIEQKVTSVLDDNNIYLSATGDLKRTSVSDFNFRYGFQYTADTLIGKTGITVGAYFENKTDLSAVRTRFYTHGVSEIGGITYLDTLINDTLSTGTVGLPMQYGIGLAINNPNYSFRADYTISDWTDVYFLGESSSALTSSSKIALGAEYTPDPNSKSFLKAVNYRIGAHTEDTNLTFNGSQLTDKGISFGFGIPFPKSMTRIDLAFEIGQFGTTDNNLVKENYYRMHLYFNAGDVWFQKRKFK